MLESPAGTTKVDSPTAIKVSAARPDPAAAETPGTTSARTTRVNVPASTTDIRSRRHPTKLHPLQRIRTHAVIDPEPHASYRTSQLRDPNTPPPSQYRRDGSQAGGGPVAFVAEGLSGSGHADDRLVADA